MLKAMEGQNLKINRFRCITPIILGLCFLIQACSTPVVSRQSSGMRPAAGPQENFSGIKKKVALLGFFNESPYGGDELGVTATEELRRELSRTGHFIIDPMGNRLFGDSREIYAGGGSKLNQVARQAKVSGINFVIYGRVTEARVRERTDEIGLIRQTKTYSEAIVEVRVFDVNSGKEIFSETMKGFADDDSYRFFMGDQEEHLAHRREMLRYAVRVASRNQFHKLWELLRSLIGLGELRELLAIKFISMLADEVEFMLVIY